MGPAKVLATPAHLAVPVRMVHDPCPEPAAIGSGGSGNAHLNDRPVTFEETLAVWERLGTALAARALLGWTQARTAGEAGVGMAAVTALELGRRGREPPPCRPTWARSSGRRRSSGKTGG